MNFDLYDLRKVIKERELVATISTRLMLVIASELNYTDVKTGIHQLINAYKKTDKGTAGSLASKPNRQTDGNSLN